VDIHFQKIAPVVNVADLDAAMDRYRRLGFAVAMDEGARYGFADRGAVSLHLAESDDPERSGCVVYIYVSDADALHAQWSAAGVEGRFIGPFDTPYDLREFVFTDADGTVHRVGSPLTSTAAPAQPR
jgi:Glyoxalase/Bleomycin resistance protein/Dioxygenase superfamily